MSDAKHTTKGRAVQRALPDDALEIAQVFSLLAFVAALLLWRFGTLLPRLALAAGVALFLLTFFFVWPRRGGPRQKTAHGLAQARKSPRHPEGPFKVTVKSRLTLATAAVPGEVLSAIDESFIDVSFASAEDLRAAFDGKVGEEALRTWLDTILLHASVEEAPSPVPTVPEADPAGIGGGAGVGNGPASGVRQEATGR
jgi:hypothetical protein